jgi:hypothetical protein
MVTILYWQCSIARHARDAIVILALEMFGVRKLTWWLVKSGLLYDYYIREKRLMAYVVKLADQASEEKENSGIWVSPEHTNEELKAMSDAEIASKRPFLLSIASTNNLGYRNTTQKAFMPFFVGGGEDPREQFKAKGKTKGGTGFIPADVQDNVTLDALADHILLNWKNMQDENGKEIQYSRENARELLRQDRALRDFVSKFAADPENYTRGSEYKVDELAGKSLNTYSGKPTMAAA